MLSVVGLSPGHTLLSALALLEQNDRASQQMECSISANGMQRDAGQSGDRAMLAMLRALATRTAPCVC